MLFLFVRFSNKIFTLKDHLPQKQVFSEGLTEDLSRLSPPKISNRHIHFHDNWNSCNVELRRSFSYFGFCRIYQSVYIIPGIIPFYCTATGKKYFNILN